MELIIVLVLTYLVLMGWLKLHTWRFNRSVERAGRRIREQAHRDYLVSSQRTAEYCAKRDADERQDLMARVTRATAGLRPTGPGPASGPAAR